eukprot:Nitzschia sp. Nitz4//scaffold2_size372955//48400//48744//NITZ4_000367-RA/size372955-processed-gene-0.392-mRNA-1//1//CDS//3329546608//53//frame0
MYTTTLPKHDDSLFPNPIGYMIHLWVMAATVVHTIVMLGFDMIYYLMHQVVLLLPLSLPSQIKIENQTDRLLQIFADFKLDHWVSTNGEAVDYIGRDDLCDHVRYERVDAVSVQ